MLGKTEESLPCNLGDLGVLKGVNFHPRPMNSKKTLRVVANAGSERIRQSKGGEGSGRYPAGSTIANSTDKPSFSQNLKVESLMKWNVAQMGIFQDMGLETPDQIMTMGQKFAECADKLQKLPNLDEFKTHLQNSTKAAEIKLPKIDNPKKPITDEELLAKINSLDGGQAFRMMSALTGAITEQYRH